MFARLAPAGLAALALAAAACTAPKSKVCRSVCAREAECIESRAEESSFDESECIAACAALDRDDQMKGIVAHHKECVDKAANCAAVLECSVK